MSNHELIGHERDSVWTIEAIRQHFSSQIAELEKTLIHRDEATAIALSAAKSSADIAILAAKAGLEERLQATAEGLLQHIEHQRDSTRLALENLDKVLHERDKAVVHARTEQREAIAKADEAMTVRLEGMNQFREQINAERGDYVRKEQINAQFAQFAQRSDDRYKDIMARLDLVQNSVSKDIRSNSDRIAKIETMDLGARLAKEEARQVGGYQREDKKESREMVVAYFLGFTTFVSSITAAILLILKLAGHLT